MNRREFMKALTVAAIGGPMAVSSVSSSTSYSMGSSTSLSSTPVEPLTIENLMDIAGLRITPFQDKLVIWSTPKEPQRVW